MVLCNICTLIRFGEGDAGPHALVPAQESKRWLFGRLSLLPVIQKGLFLGPKSQEKLDTQIRAFLGDDMQLNYSNSLLSVIVALFCSSNSGSFSSPSDSARRALELRKLI